MILCMCFIFWLLWSFLLMGFLWLPSFDYSLIVAPSQCLWHHELSCSVGCGIFLDQGSNLCPPHWQAGSYHRATREDQRCVIFKGGFWEIICIFSCAISFYFFILKISGLPWRSSGLRL